MTTEHKPHSAPVPGGTHPRADVPAEEYRHAKSTVCKHDGYRSSYVSSKEAWVKCCKCGRKLYER